MKKAEVRARIEEIGIIPGIRASKPERALFAAEAVNRSGIPIAEITMTVPGAIEVISRLAKISPEMVVGAGTVLDAETARRCLDAGAMFLTSTGLVSEVVEFSLKNDVVVFPGALTPTEVIAAWKMGADFVKVFPCGQMGGPNYIRALKLPFPQVPLIATGGVNQQTAGNFILAGAAALGIGSELLNPEGLPSPQEQQIRELSRRYIGMVQTARAQKKAQKKEG
jgi:2-dehydro-3-deoxyphosphogluconate aldolase / (4S)-4-hydroxy-2-oxoglutarate aldolase